MTGDQIDAGVRDEVRAVAARAREAAAVLATLSRAQKDAALLAMADALAKHSAQVEAANAEDVQAARDAGTDPYLIDRLTLNGPRIEAIADALRDVAALPDPVGDVVRGYRLPNGVELRQVRVPLGVIGMIYEARPNVTADAAGLCLKSGNAALLRGSASAYRTNEELVAVLRDALAGTDVPVDAVQLVPGRTHDSVAALMAARGLVDVVIPRGGAELIQRVVTSSLVPVIETGAGNVHMYVDAEVDQDQAVELLINSKVQRCTVCNALETLLVHQGIAAEFLPKAYAALAEAGVTVHADPAALALADGTAVTAVPVTDEDWAAEYYSLDLAVGVVPDLTSAVQHIRRWSTGHTEAICTTSTRAADAFVAGVDSAVVAVNASTRFTDGGEFGFGAEIGISTQKMHARGPMGLPELTSTTYVLTGQGQTRQ